MNSNTGQAKFMNKEKLRKAFNKIYKIILTSCIIGKLEKNYAEYTKSLTNRITFYLNLLI